MDSEPSQHWSEAALEREFPVLQRCLYVNHAAVSPWPRRSCEAVTHYARENMLNGPAAYGRWLATEQRLRERAARLLGAAPTDLALTGNTSEGINLVAAGLPWRAGDNVVLPEREFLSNHLPWERLGADGVELRTVDLRAAEDPEAALLDRVDGRTRLLAVSSVQWTDGLRLDLPRLGQALRSVGVLFFVDAIQELGAFPMDVEAAAIDALSAGCHKWQMGPEGAGLFYCRAELRERLALTRFGWRMLDDPFRFEIEDRPVATSGRRFETGSPNTMGRIALEASLSLLESFGARAAGQRVLGHSERLTAGLAALPGVELVTRTEPGRLAGIVSFRARGWSAQDLVQALAARGVLCIQREDFVRLSPHFYQPEHHMDAVLGRVESLLKR